MIIDGPTDQEWADIDRRQDAYKSGHATGLATAQEQINITEKARIEWAIKCDSAEFSRDAWKAYALKLREAMKLGAFHHDACPWLNGEECCCANEKVKHALSIPTPDEE